MYKLIKLFLIFAFLFNISCVSGKSNKKVNWELDLKKHEDLGGHVIARHVGKSEDYLKNRLKKQPHISAASTFNDLNTAQYAVEKGILYHKNKIKKWLKSDKSRLVVIYKGKKTIGIGIKQGSNKFRDLKNAKIVLKKHKKLPFLILTAYPY